MSRCGFHTIEGDKIWIPGCIGGAVNGKNGCTCYSYKMKHDAKLSHVDKLEAECRSLKSMLDASQKENRKLKDQNMQLLRQGLPINIRRRLDHDHSYIYFLLEKLRAHFPVTPKRILSLKNRITI